MTLSIDDIGLSLEIDDELLDRLVVEGKSHYPNEFGGFLIGHYQNDNRHLVISNSIKPDSFRASKLSFERSTNGIEAKLKSYFAESPQKIYVGEWHTHPDNRPIPSSTDLRAIKTIGQQKITGIANPVLLIIGYNSTKVEFGFYVLVNNKLYTYE